MGGSHDVHGVTTAGCLGGDSVVVGLRVVVGPDTTAEHTGFKVNDQRVTIGGGHR